VVAVLVDELVEVGPAVKGLLGFGGPAAVGGFVVAVIVLPVERVRRRRFRRKIGDEVVEHVPTSTNANASTAIVGVATAKRIIAAVQHHRPREMKWMYCAG
jgi:hypothetical protein